MAIRVKNQLVSEILAYLNQQPEGDHEADRLYNELLADQTEATYEEISEAGELPKNRTRGGAWIV